MVEVAEKQIADLRESVASLEKEVAQLSGLNKTSDEFRTKVRATAELITQALLNVDSVQISKDAAANTLREGDRKTSRQMAVLLARRKTVVKKLNGLGDQVDKLTTLPVEEAEE